MGVQALAEVGDVSGGALEVARRDVELEGAVDELKLNEGGGGKDTAKKLRSLPVARKSRQWCCCKITDGLSA